MMATTQPYLYEIHIEGLITDQWSDWFEGLAIQNHANQTTTISGLLADQAALFGVLTKIHALNLNIISVRRLSRNKHFKNIHE
jgi:hypothetical protein